MAPRQELRTLFTIPGRQAHPHSVISAVPQRHLLYYIKKKLMLGIMIQVFSSSTREAEAGGSKEVKARLLYTASSRSARATQKNSVSKKSKKGKKEKTLRN